MRMLQLAQTGLLTIALVGSACTGSTHAPGRSTVQARNDRAVYLVAHSHDLRPDVAASIQADFRKRGYLVSTGPENEIPADVDLVVRYNASWSRSPSVYLRSVSILLYDARTQELLDSGSWKNGAPNRFDKADSVVGEIMEEIARKVGLAGYGSAPR